VKHPAPPAPAAFADDRCTAAAFEARYAASEDPWNFGASNYERRRYALTLRALGRPRYERAYEPGCSIGEFTVLLAERCDELLASDFAPSAVARARRRCADHPQVQVRCADVAHESPEGRFDLIVFSELGYYFERPELMRIAQNLAGHLVGGGELIAVHWLGASADHRLHGDVVHEALRACLPLQWICGERHEESFRIDRWRRV
jgi:trans-aconitate methyltransferase